MRFCWRPPPRPRLRRSSPAPSRGRGQCLRYQVSSRARFFPRISPCSGPWGYRHGGWRLAGRGNSFPLPCLQLPRHRNPCGPTPPAPSPADYPYSSAVSPHPSRAFGAPPPPPPRGRWQCLRYQVSSRTRGVAGGQPCTGPWGYRVWGWRLAGRGNSFPRPCLSRSKHLASRCRHFCEGYPCTSAAPPTPPAPAALLPRPHRGAGSVRGDIR